MLNIGTLGILSLVRPFHVLGRTGVGSDNFVVEQFENKGLAHFSYTVMAGTKIIVIDPQRNPQIYYDYAKRNKATIIGVVETHPHADFVSSHLQMHKELQVPVYSSGFTNASYPATAVDDGDQIKLSDLVGLRVLYTPGHAPDHISVVLHERGKDIAVFSGDSLLIGDVGRPDLRDFSKDEKTQRKELAEMMYETVHQKFDKLSDNVILYPAHGAGSLCGKSIRKAAESTIGYEKRHNHALQIRTKAEFVSFLLNDQPFVPKYFPYNVGLNLKGAPDFDSSVAKVRRLPGTFEPEENALIVDSRPASVFKNSYLDKAINIQEGGSFETWLGTIVGPESAFYLIGADEDALIGSIRKAASIGYETNIKGAFVYDSSKGEKFSSFDTNGFNPEDNEYTYLDVRMPKEVMDVPVFPNNVNIPLQDLMDRISEIPSDKPVLVSCASGYRSAIASSIIKSKRPELSVYDLGAKVVDYKKPQTKK